MAEGTFTASVEEWVEKSEKALTAVARQSIQDVIEIAQTPVGKGGRMRVDTGFLRASGQASLNGMPTGPVRGAKDGSYQTDEGLVVAQLSQLQLGMTFFFGWTANYAKYRELYDGFLEGALQQWQSVVTKNTLALKARMTK